MAGDKTAGSSWTEQDKIVFLLDLMETGAMTIDWKKANLPAGRTRNACSLMLRRLRTAHQAELDELKAARATASSSAGGDPKPTAAQAKKKGKAAAGKGAKNDAVTKVKKAPAKRVRSSSEDEADEDDVDVPSKRIQTEPV
ncbi:hypothetical protein K490DRAFT_64471 [Saccharata proteae CBS 121410]|uniref:Uncharacterized protein n=1 Tax=Saccharata proteae CBS 121410 TaxID=1314787 RepID=A0A9P4HXR9_9PEZI|nr:hypothetical protein K490DRAFT_64471 [Saccharata proteae CBS 121410]